MEWNHDALSDGSLAALRDQTLRELKASLNARFPDMDRGINRIEMTP